MKTKDTNTDIDIERKIAVDALEDIKQVLNRLTSWDFEAMPYPTLMQTFGRIERIIDVATTQLEDEWKRNDNRSVDKPHTTVADHPFMGVDFVCGNGNTSLTTSIIDHLINDDGEIIHPADVEEEE